MKRVAYLAENTGGFADPGIDLGQVMHQSGHNIGNFAFWNATRLLFDAEIRCFSFGARPGSIRSDVDFIVIPAANFLNAQSDLGWLADILVEHDKPCLVAGLGAQSESEDRMPPLSEGTLRFLREAARRTPFLAVRGEFSQRLCARHGIHNTRVLGCPSIFTAADRRLGERLRQRWQRPVDKLAIHASSLKAHVRQAERFLFSLLFSMPGSPYVIQRPVELMKLARGDALNEAEQAYADKARAFLAPDLPPHAFARVLRQSGMVPYSVDAWRFALGACSHALGTRIHGTLLSLSAGVPAICITHDTRTRELCAVLKVPQVDCADVKGQHGVGEMFAASVIDAQAFEDNRGMLARQYKALLEELGLGASRYLHEHF